MAAQSLGSVKVRSHSVKGTLLATAGDHRREAAGLFGLS